MGISGRILGSTRWRMLGAPGKVSDSMSRVLGVTEKMMGASGRMLGTTGGCQPPYPVIQSSFSPLEDL